MGYVPCLKHVLRIVQKQWRGAAVIRHQVAQFARRGRPLAVSPDADALDHRREARLPLVERVSKASAPSAPRYMPGNML